MTQRLQSAHAWAAWAGVTILDPDGWRRNAPLGERSMDDEITEDEFVARLSISTIGPANYLSSPSAITPDEPTPPSVAAKGHSPSEETS